MEIYCDIQKPLRHCIDSISPKLRSNNAKHLNIVNPHFSDRTLIITCEKKFKLIDLNINIRYIMTECHSFSGGLMDKKQRIIDATIELYLKNGIEKTTISHIVKEAGIAQGTFYLYFPTKLAVMPAIAEQMVAKVHEKLININPNAPIQEKLQQCMTILFSNTETYQELTKLIYTGFTQTEEVKQWETIYRPLYDWVFQVIREAQMNAEITTELDAKVLARIIIGAIESTAEQIYLFDDSPTTQVDHVKDNLLRFILNGLN